MKSPSSPSPRPGPCATRVLAALALVTPALPLFGEVNMPFDTDLSGFAGSGVVWSPKFGGSLAFTNTTNWSIVGSYTPSGAVNDEITLMMTNGGVIEFDLIVDTDGLAVGDSVSPVVAANSSGGWDQENNFPRITAAQVAGGAVTQRVSRLIMPNEPYIGNDGEFHLAPTSWRNFNFGRSDGSTGTTTYHIDNLTFRANAGPLPIPNPLDPELITFATDANGFATFSWEPTASSAHDAAFGGSLRISIPAATVEKNFWWTSNASMSSKFALKLNAARTTGAVLSYDIIAPTGTLATLNPQVVFQMGGAPWSWSQFGGGIALDRIVDLGGGFEKVTIRQTIAAFRLNTATLYSGLGFGISRTPDQPALTYYIDNIVLTPSHPSAALGFDTDEENFTAILDAHTTATDTTLDSPAVVVAAATGLAVGMIASGNANLPAGATIVGLDGTTVTLSAPATATGAGVATTFTAPVNPTAAWSGTYGGTLAVTSPGAPGESFRWVADSAVDATFGATLNYVLRQGGTLSYDLIADTGVLSTLRPRTSLQQMADGWTFLSNDATSTVINPADIVALPSGRELTRVTVPVANFAVPPHPVDPVGAVAAPYARLGLGVVYTSASPVSFHVDNIQVQASYPSTFAALTFETGAEGFANFQLGAVVHSDRFDPGAGSLKCLYFVGEPRGQQWLGQAFFSANSVPLEAKALGNRLVEASRAGGTLSFDVIFDNLSVTNPTPEFAAGGLGVKVALLATGSAFQQRFFPMDDVTLPLAPGEFAVRTITVPLYAAGSTATDGFVLAEGTQFEVLIGSIAPETLVATADTTTTEGSPVVTVADTTGISVGLTVNGAGLPNAIRVISVDSPTQLTLSANVAAGGVITGATYTRPVATRVDIGVDNFAVTANPAPIAPVISTPPTINLDGQWVAGRVLAAFAEGATYSATGLPAGLSLDPATGIISGRPSANGSFTVTFTVTTEHGVATVEVEWAVTGAGTPNLVVTSFDLVAGAATIQWTGAAGTPVTVQRSTDLITWTDLATGVTAETYTDPASPSPRAFYRVVIP